jgi:hypothetical protein
MFRLDPEDFITKPNVAKNWGYAGGNDYANAQTIAEKAQQMGFTAIRYSSERGIGANLAIFRNFEKIRKKRRKKRVKYSFDTC